MVFFIGEYFDSSVVAAFYLGVFYLQLQKQQSLIIYIQLLV